MKTFLLALSLIAGSMTASAHGDRTPNSTTRASAYSTPRTISMAKSWQWAWVATSGTCKTVTPINTRLSASRRISLIT